MYGTRCRLGTDEAGVCRMHQDFFYGYKLLLSLQITEKFKQNCRSKTPLFRRQLIEFSAEMMLCTCILQVLEISQLPWHVAEWTEATSACEAGQMCWYSRCLHMIARQDQLDD